jgi:CSLREA domain-containing protein
MKRPLVLTSRLSPLVLRLSGLLALTLVALWLVGAGHASTPDRIVVNSYEDSKDNDGVCTLREAIIAANKDKKSGPALGECAAGSGADTIILPPGTYILSRSDKWE